MRLSELFDVLASGELNNLHIVKDYKVSADKQEVVLRSINLALLDLYTRFFIKRGVYEETLAKITLPFTKTIGSPDLIEITKIELNGETLSQSSYRMQSHDTFVLSPAFNDPKTVYQLDNAKLRVEYKAKPVMLTEQDIIDDSEVQLPLSYLNALVLFIGSRLYSSIVNQLDGDLNESSRYLQRYYAEIEMLTNQGIDVDELDEHNWFWERGFI